LAFALATALPERAPLLTEDPDFERFRNRHLARFERLS